MDLNIFMADKSKKDKYSKASFRMAAEEVEEPDIHLKDRKMEFLIRNSKKGKLSSVMAVILMVLYKMINFTV